jgi:hypothetical protein
VPRIRTIKPAFLHDEALDDLGDTARLVYVGLWMYADRDGRLEDRPRYLSRQILPYRPHLFEPALAALLDGGWVARYGVNGKSYLHLPKFLTHQRPHHTEPASDLPAPPLVLNGETTVVSPLSDGEAPDGNIKDLGNDQGRERRMDHGAAPPSRTGCISDVGVVWDAWRSAFTQHVGQPLALTPKGADSTHLRTLADAHLPRGELEAALRLFLTAPGYVTKRSLGMFCHLLPELRAWLAQHGADVPFGDKAAIRQSARRDAGQAAEMAFLTATDGS